jgi:hypothetical protein
VDRRGNPNCGHATGVVLLADQWYAVCPGCIGSVPSVPEFVKPMVTAPCAPGFSVPGFSLCTRYGKEFKVQTVQNVLERMR